jgi:hypothetical protein
MTKEQALYFMEGLACGMAAPDAELVKKLFCLLAQQYEITVADMDGIRLEVDAYLDKAEAEKSQ